MINSLYNFLNRHSLLLALIWLVILFALFYPAKYINIDEHDYVQNAGLLVSGELRQECNGGESQFKVNDYCISKYNPGTSVFLLPTVFVSPTVGFAITFLVFAAGIVTFHKFLLTLRIDTIYVFLYALFPAFVYYSRTMMSEMYSATLILAVVYFLWQEQILPQLRWGILAGMAAGLAVFVRYTNAIPLALIFLVLYLPAFHRRNFSDIFNHMAGVLLGGLPWLVIILAFNSYLYGAPLRSGYYWSGEEGIFLANQIMRTPPLE